MKMMVAARVCMLALCFSACGSPAMPPAPLPRTGETAANELLDFAAFLDDMHPDAYRFTSREALDALVRAESARLRAIEAPSDLDVGLSFERVAASIHDAHMFVGVPTFRDDSDVPLSLLPLLVERVGDEVFIDACTTPLPRGTTLLAIDGRPIAEILDALSPIVSYEGTNEAARDRALVHGFVRLYSLTYGLRDEYSITVRSLEGETTNHVLAGVSMDVLAELGASRHSRDVRSVFIQGDDPYPTLTVLDAQTRLLRLPSFGVTDVEGYRARIDGLVAEIGGAPRLVIDVRGNQGGLRSHGIALLNHLADAPYVQWTRAGVRARSIPSRYAHAITPAFGASLDRLSSYPRAQTDGLHVLEGDPLASWMTPTAPRLTPTLIVLTDGLTNSAANELALALRSIRPDAIFIGDEIGGECERHVGELPVLYTTPTFGIVVLMSLIRIEHVEVPGCEFGRGLRPDVQVVYDRASFIEGRDVYLEAAAAASRPHP